ncbi:nicotinate phosphoribosyltransferase, partial [bacterium]
MPNAFRHFGNNDLYTYTVKRVVWERFPHLEVEYAFKNRDGTDLRPYADRIRAKVRELDGLAPSAAEIQKLRETGFLAGPFLEALAQFRMSADHVEIGERDGRFDLRIRGPWYQTIDLEVPVLQIVNEAVFEAQDTPAVRAEGERRLDAKIERMRAVAREASETVGAFPFRIIEMGTRRAFSPEWHGHALERLTDGLPDVLLGTSNLYWGERLGLKLYGTFSHQGPMAMQTQVPIQR